MHRHEANHSVGKSKDELLKYWRSSNEKNTNPSNYLHGNKRSEYLVSLVKRYVNSDASILELGCNVGLNLNHLWKAGYRNLTGVEVNPEALQLMRQNFPDMQVISYEGAIEDRIKELGEYDLVFTLAVLEHVHNDSEWVFSEIAQKAKGHLITIEGEERIDSKLHFPRNYKNIFESMRFQQVYEKKLGQKEGLNTNFYARVFSGNRGLTLAPPDS